MIEILNLKQYLCTVYEEWCATMLKYSRKREDALMAIFRERFEVLAQKIAPEQGIPQFKID